MIQQNKIFFKWFLYIKEVWLVTGVDHIVCVVGIYVYDKSHQNALSFWIVSMLDGLFLLELPETKGEFSAGTHLNKH